MGFFGDLKEGFDNVVRSGRDAGNKERDRQRRERKNTTKNADGTYTTTSSNGTKITSGFAPGEAIQRNAGSGFDMFNPALQGAADARGVGLYTAYRGGRLMSTPEYDKSYLSRNGGMGMDYTRMHMNPLEFMGAYSREQTGQPVNWQQEGFAGQYSPVPESIRSIQDLYRQMGYSFNGAAPAMPQMPQYPSAGGVPLGGGGGYTGGMGGGYNGSGINPGGMYGPLYGGGGTMYAGGSPYFNEYTGQYQYPTAPNGNAGINPGGMYGQLPQLPQMNLTLPQQQNIDWNSIFSMMMPMMMGSMNTGGYGGYGGGFPMTGGYGYGF